jgi:hypothetical protein
MHVLQHIAIKINNYPDEIVSLEECKEEAHNTVKGIFEDMYSESEGLGGWSDWYVVGGGRYNSNPDNQYEEKNAWNDVISYADNPELFRLTTDRSIISRLVEFGGYRKRFEEKGISLSDSLDKYEGQMDFSFDLYDLSKCIDMLQGKWDMNSYFYDITNYTTNTKYMLEDLDNNGKFWYLIPVDFHF